MSTIIDTKPAATWRLEDRIFVWSDGQPVMGLVPARMTQPVRALVGAAPDLLAALRLVFHPMNPMDDDGETVSILMTREQVDAMQAAIAAAEGR